MLTLRPSLDYAQYVEWQEEENAPGGRVYAQVAIESFGAYLAALRQFGLVHKSLLDVGCRDGAVLEYAKQTYPQITTTGVDIVPSFVKLAVTRGVNAIEADAHALPWNDYQFDVAYCAQTLEHCHTPSTVLSELARVAKHSIFIGVPLERTETYEANLSHYVHSDDPYDWLALYRDVLPTWTPFKTYIEPKTTYFNTILVRNGVRDE